MIDGPENHVEGKQNNKLFIQQALGLIQDDSAPLFFWPSRLDMIEAPRSKLRGRDQNWAPYIFPRAQLLF